MRPMLSTEHGVSIVFAVEVEPTITRWGIKYIEEYRRHVFITFFPITAYYWVGGKGLVRGS